jgi:hypothetical protein
MGAKAGIESCGNPPQPPSDFGLATARWADTAFFRKMDRVA